MHTETSVLIRSDAATVYALAAEVPRWPQILPHYRSVRVLHEEDGMRVVRMAASRDVIPVSWTAEQRLFPDIPRITFRHIGGVTTGMEVEWRFEPAAEGVLVSIRHDLDLGWPLLGRFAADRVIGPYFVEAIAGKTLARMKELAEAGELSSLPDLWRSPSSRRMLP